MLKLIMIIFLFAGVAAASEPEDTTKAKPKDNIEKKINDKSDSSIKQQKGKRDFFIDKDGDGICDNRAKGMGFERQRKKARPGGHGKGGPGGNK